MVPWEGRLRGHLSQANPKEAAEISLAVKEWQGEREAKVLWGGARERRTLGEKSFLG